MTTMLRLIRIHNAAWREAARFRHPETDVDHLLLGLVSAGGSAAALLGRFGVTLSDARAAVLGARRDTGSLGIDASRLPEPEPLAIADLHVDSAGEIPTAHRAQALLDAMPRTWSENDLLVALVAEPSETARDILARCGVDADAIAEEARTAAPFGASEPRRCSPDPDLTAPHHRTTTFALQIEHMISAPAETVRRAATDPRLARIWLNYGDQAAIVDGTLQMSMEKRGRRQTHVLNNVIDSPAGDAFRVVWQVTLHAPYNRWDGVDGGYHELLLRAVPGGTMAEYTYAGRTFGRLRTVVAPIAHLGQAAAMPHRMQNLAFVTADLASGDASTS